MRIIPIMPVPCLNILAIIYFKRDQYIQAEITLMQSLDLRQQVLGPKHPDIAHSLHNFAIIYQACQKYSEAKHLYEQAIEICTQTLDNDHPFKARILWNY